MMMASNEETHILNLIRNLLLEEKERERMSALRSALSDTLSHENPMSTHCMSKGMPSLSDMMATAGHTSGAGHHQDMHTSAGMPYSISRPGTGGQSSLNYLNLTQFDSQSVGAHQSIDDLLGLSVGSGRSSAGAIPPLVPPMSHQSGLLSSSRPSSDDSSSEASHILLSNLSNYASLVNTTVGQSSSGLPPSSMSFLMDSMGSPVSSMSTSMCSASTLMTRFESQIRTIANDIQTTIQLHLNGLQMRKEQLLKQLEHIKQTYATVLTIAGHSGDDAIPFPLPQITFTRPDSALYKAVTTLGFLTTPALAVNCTATGDGVEMAIEGEATCFTITTRNCFNEELLIGGEHLDIDIVLSGDTCGSTSSSLSSGSGSLGGHSIQIPHSLLDHNNGKYTVTYTIPRGIKMAQVHVAVAVNGMPITGSPYVVSVENQRTRNAWKRIATFGGEGSQVGQFCRPWGVAIVRLPANKDLNYDTNGGTGGGKEYLIAVADRSNNRIQLLRLSLKTTNNGNHVIHNGSSLLLSASGGAGSNGFSPSVSSSAGGGHYSSNASGQDVQLSVVHVFGSGPGTRPGQFDRPAGIAINVNLGHIIVADKDNHRIQVFDITGTYLFKFGEKGSRPGQFCYPWDIDSCAQTSQILVSDTRNRRVQLFTPYGQYLWHCGQPLDSPRGVSFISADRFVISDFNKHRLLIIDKNASNAGAAKGEDIAPKYIGFGEGSAWGEFLRPQGVVSSGATQIFCSDSRNNRISVWNSATQSFEYLTDEVLSLDRPSGLSVCDNLLVVVDFGNNRIQICQR